MANLALIALGVGGVALLALSGGRKGGGSSLNSIRGLPTSSHISYKVIENAPLEVLRFGAIVPLYDGAPVYRDQPIRAKAFSKEFHRLLDERNGKLPASADKINTDNLSKEAYWGPSWLLMIDPDKLDMQHLQTAVNGVPFDEFGRLKPGHYGNSPQDLWGQTFGALIKNPLFAAVVTVAVLAAPGGIAIYGAYTLWQMKGQDLTLQNVALQGARSAVVAECGPACGVAFDFGVGVMSGQPVDKAAENALVKQMSPAERKAYDDGKKLYREMA